MPIPESQPAFNGVPQCAHCGRLIGLHEPAVRVERGLASISSRAAEPERSADSCEVLYHAACYEHVRQRDGRDSPPL